MMYICPCCGYRTLDEEPPGSYFICDICFWEDEDLQYYDPDFEGGANQFSLRQAQLHFKKYEHELLHKTSRYEYVGARDIANIRRVSFVEMYKLFKTMDAPLNKLLQLYSGLLIKKEDSKFIYSYEEIVNVYIESDCWIRYLNLKESSQQNLNDIEMQEELKKIEQHFIDQIQRIHPDI